MAAAEQLLQRSRQRATAAMTQVRHVERLLHPTAARPAAAEADDGTRSKDVTQLVEHELAAHLRAVELHEAAAQLQEELGWLARAAAARAHAVVRGSCPGGRGRSWPGSRRWPPPRSSGFMRHTGA
jgi:hypothetical protein